MPPKQNKMYVVDASIARAASGKDSTHPVPEVCRRVMEDILANGHSIVMDRTMFEEWKRHESGYAKKWKTGMFARKRLETISTEGTVAFIEEYEKCDMSDRCKSAIKKDLHILKCALLRGAVIVTNDRRLKECVETILDCIPRLRDLTWLIPIDSLPATK